MTARCGCGRALDDVGLHCAPYTELCTGRNTRLVGPIGIGRVAQIGRTLDTGGPGPVVGDHYGADGVHRVFRDASPDWIHPYLPRPMFDRYPDETRQRLQRMAATPEREQLLRGAYLDTTAELRRRYVAAYTAEQDAADRHDIPLTARDQLVIALTAAAVTALILRAVTRRWWWTA